MRHLALIGVFLACAAAAPGAYACGPQGRDVEIEIVVDAAATAQSKSFQVEATRLDGKADTEEGASVTVLASARALRRRAASIRAQAALVSSASQPALFAKADKLDVEAATNDAASVSFLARARLIRARAKALRILSARVLTSGVITTQVLARVQLPAAPTGHPDSMPLKMLDAVPKVASSTTMMVKHVQI